MQILLSKVLLLYIIMLTRLIMHVNAKIKKKPNKAIIKTISQDALTKHVDGIFLIFLYLVF